MTDVKAKQCDRDEAHFLAGKLAMDLGINLTGDAIRDLFYASYARHRQAAEKATREECAAHLERRGQEIMDASPNRSTGNMMRAIYAEEATAIRSQKNG